MSKNQTVLTKIGLLLITLSILLLIWAWTPLPGDAYVKGASVTLIVPFLIIASLILLIFSKLKK